MDESDLAAALGVELEELPNYLIRLRWYVARCAARRGLDEVYVDDIVSDLLFRVLIQRRVRRPNQTAEQFVWSITASLVSHTREQLTIPGRTNEDGKTQRVDRLQSIDAVLDPLQDFTSKSHQQTMEFNELCAEIRKELGDDLEACAVFELHLQGWEKPRHIAATLGISVDKTNTARRRLERKVNKVLERLGRCSIKTKN